MSTDTETLVPVDGVDFRLDLARAFRDIRDARSRIKEIEDTAKAEHERIDDWVERETKSDRRLIALHEATITEWHLQRRAESGDDVKAHSTAYGEVRSVAYAEPEYEKDEHALRAWAVVHGFIRRRETVDVDWARIKSEARRSGPILMIDNKPVSGVRVVDRDPKVYVEPAD